MHYLRSSLKAPKFYILWFFLIIISGYLLWGLLINNTKFPLILIITICIQILILFTMSKIYETHIQTFIKMKILPITLQISKYNLALDFNAPTFYQEEEHDILMFHGYFSNEYLSKNFKHTDTLNRDIEHHINLVWKSTVLYLKKYKKFLASILAYNFIFGLLLLLYFLLTYHLITFGEDIIYQKLYLFFTFISFSFWLYSTILLLKNESIIELKHKNSAHNLYTIFDNFGTLLNIENIQQSEHIIETYINISTSILYATFLAALSLLI